MLYLPSQWTLCILSESIYDKKSPKINNYTYLELSEFYRYWCHMHLLTHFQRAASARGLQPFAANLCCFQLIFCLVVLAVLALYCRFHIIEAI